MPLQIHHKNRGLTCRTQVLSVLSAALDAVAPDRLLRDALAFDGQSVARGRKQALNAADHLARNAAYPFLEATGDLITTAPTNTNVNDLVCLFVTSPSPSDPTP